MIKNIINNITYPLRMKLAFSRPIKKIANEDKTGIFNSQKTLPEEKRLLSEYNLESLQSDSSIVHYKENIYTLKLLEDSFKHIQLNTKEDTLKILDIGSKNFSYAPAIHNFFKRFKCSLKTQKQIVLDGIEIDPYRLLSDLHSRYDYAQYYTRKLNNTNYITGNLLDHNESRYDIITWFLPFIIKDPLISWGLPTRYFKPEKMLKHAYKLLSPRGIILLVNQGKTEKQVQIDIIKELNLNYTELKEPYTNLFSPYKLERYITIVTKG